MYTKPFSVLIAIAEELERVETNKLSVKYLSDKLRLGRKTILLILSLLEKLGLVRVETVDMYERGDVYVSITGLGDEVAKQLKDVFYMLKSRLDVGREFLPFDVRIDLKLLRNGFYAGVITVGLEDIWYYLTEDQKRELEDLVVLTVSGRLYSKEAMEKLLDMGIKIPYLKDLLKRMGNLLVSAEMLTKNR